MYLTNSLYGAWDDQFYPDGVGYGGISPIGAGVTLAGRTFVGDHPVMGRLRAQSGATVEVDATRQP
jgi:hypothetical protein